VSHVGAGAVMTLVVPLALLMVVLAWWWFLVRRARRSRQPDA
jgi:membrane protein DedA with SNARE-associated domain